MKNKILSVLLVFAFLFTTVAVTSVVADDVDENAVSFTDVPENAWYKAEADYVSSRGIMAGADKADTFKPDMLMSRAMTVTTLYRIDGSPDVSANVTFKDLTHDWYLNAVAWASENGIVTGRDANVFDPDGAITRQEFATIVYRYIEYRGFYMTDEADVTSYADAEELDSWAQAAMEWNVGNGVINGKGVDDIALLDPKGETTRAEAAALLMRVCKKFIYFEEADGMGSIDMTLEEILLDLKSDRVKKVIVDSDAYNEMDDQYAIAYALSSPKMNVVGINAALFNNYRCDGFSDGMLKSYEEIGRVLEKCGKAGEIPTYKGCALPISQTGSAISSEATQNIRRVARASDEMLYVIVTGAITNVAAALKFDSTLADRICVIWLGSQCVNHTGDFGEFNLAQDFKAGQYVLDCGVNLVLLPALGPEGYGTQMLRGNRETLNLITGDSESSVFFREELPADFNAEFADPENDWTHTFWDLAGPAVVGNTDALNLQIITAPRLTNDWGYAFEEGRHQIIYMESLNAEMVFEDAFGCISTIGQ